MLLITIAALTLLALCNYVISGRKLLYPPVVLCLVWAGTLLMILLAGDFFYPISSDTLCIFILGSAAFSAGASLVSRFHAARAPSQQTFQISDASNRLLTVAVIAILLMCPLFYYRVASVAGGYGAPTFLMTARMAMLDLAEKGQDSFFTNMASLSIMISLIAFNESDRGRWRAALALTASLFLNVMTGARSGIVVLTLSCIAVDWVKVNRVRWKFVLSAALLFVLSFAVMAFYLHKGVGNGDSLGEDLSEAGHQLVLYAAGGPVGFDVVVRNPSVIPHNWQVDHFFLAVLKAAGVDVEMPSQHSEFVNLGPNGLSGNVFTMYFAYFDWGLAGMMFLLFFAGIAASAVFRHALVHGGISTLVFSTFFTATVLSTFSEFFYRGLGSPLRMFLVAWVIYSSPHYLRAFRRMVWKASQAYVAEAGVTGSVAL